MNPYKSYIRVLEAIPGSLATGTNVAINDRRLSG